jgi:hypothetical protein
MWWDGKITRTFRCRLTQAPGNLGRLLQAVGNAGGLIGEIRIVTMGSTAMVRDITVYADDIKHLDRLIRLIRGIPGVELLEVRDEVLEMHQGGKIAIRSRYDISSLSTLRRVYTPGAAGFALSKMLMVYFKTPVLGADIDASALERLGEAGGTPSDLKTIMGTADVVIATTGVPGLIKKDTVRKGQIILALSNPNPEIEPAAAMEAGAAFAADGKLVNNVLGFPGIFRGAVDANVPRITREMLIAAAEAIAGFAPEGEIVPNPLDKNLHRTVARAVARVAIEQGLNRDDLTGYFD